MIDIKLNMASLSYVHDVASPPELHTVASGSLGITLIAKRISSQVQSKASTLEKTNQLY
jgi:hypothetical protein